MVSGAGRQDTNRSSTAFAARRTNAAWSIRHVIFRTKAINRPSPSPSSTDGSPAISRSTNLRSSTDRQAVSRTSRVARHSLIRPSDNAASVQGISVVRAFAKPRIRPPRAGDSRRANATCAPTPIPCFSAGKPARSWPARTDESRAAATRAWAAPAAAFNSSRARNRSTRPASESTAIPASASAEDNSRTTDASAATDPALRTPSGAVDPAGGSASAENKERNAGFCVDGRAMLLRAFAGRTVTGDVTGLTAPVVINGCISITAALETWPVRGSGVPLL